MGIISRITDWITTPFTIYLILKDPMVSRSTKIRSIIGLALIFAYIVAPIDIVPDFIPMSGWLDDLVVVPLGLAVMRKLIPDINLMERRSRAEAGVRQVLLWTIISLAIAAFLVIAWLGMIIYIIVRLVAS